MNGDTSIVITGSNGDKVFIFNTGFPMVVDIGDCGDCRIHRTFGSWQEIEKTQRVIKALLENREKLGGL